MLKEFLGVDGADLTSTLANGIAHAVISEGPLKLAKQQGRISREEFEETMHYAASKIATLFTEYQYGWSNSDSADVLVSSLQKHLIATADWEEPELDFSDCQHGDEIMNEMAVGSV